MADLMNDVASHIPAKWRLVGIQLELPSGILDSIDNQNASKPNGCLMSFNQVFSEWERQKTKPHTWKTIINVLHAPAVGEHELSDKIVFKYCRL